MATKKTPAKTSKVRFFAWNDIDNDRVILDDINKVERDYKYYIKITVPMFSPITCTCVGDVVLEYPE
jgi:hypothetical protein